VSFTRNLTLSVDRVAIEILKPNSLIFGGNPVVLLSLIGSNKKKLGKYRGKVVNVEVPDFIKIYCFFP